MFIRPIHTDKFYSRSASSKVYTEIYTTMKRNVKSSVTQNFNSCTLPGRGKKKKKKKKKKKERKKKSNGKKKRRRNNNNNVKKATTTTQF